MVAGLEVQTSAHENTVVVVAAGEVDIATAPVMNEALIAAISDHAEAQLVCCDLSRVTFLDSSGIGTLAAANRRAKAEGLEFCLAGATGPIQKILRLTAMDRVFRCYDSVEAAGITRGDDQDPVPVA